MHVLYLNVQLLSGSKKQKVKIIKITNIFHENRIITSQFQFS